jgi:hypothetical protein
LKSARHARSFSSTSVGSNELFTVAISFSPAFLIIDLLMMPVALLVIVTLIRASSLLSQLIGVRAHTVMSFAL